MVQCIKIFHLRPINAMCADATWTEKPMCLLLPIMVSQAAAKGGHEQSVQMQMQLDRGADVAAVDRNSRTALTHVVVVGESPTLSPEDV
jgi:hypothetical protein